MKRRSFLRLGGLALFTGSTGGLWASASPVGVPLSVTQQPHGSGQVLVVVFLRGGLDGMHALVPYGESEYYRARPVLAVPPPTSESGLALDQTFALNPALRALVPHFREGCLAPICAVGTSDRSRSHFIAQDFLEFGGEQGRVGWLNRSLSDQGWGLSTRPQLPSLLQGPRPVLNITSWKELEDWAAAPVVFEGSDQVSRLSREEEKFRQQLSGLKLRSSGRYPESELARQLETVALLLKAGVELEAVHCELGGFDSHSRQIDGLWPGRLLGVNYLLHQFATAVDAFWRDLRDGLQERVTLMTVTEFGRRLSENASLGTDHGFASAGFVLGRRVQGGKVQGRWPGLRADQLVDGIDLDVGTDYRTILNEYRASIGASTLFPEWKARGVGLFLDGTSPSVSNASPQDDE